MVKDCKVIFTNDLVTVLADGKKEVQIPSIKREASMVRVLINGNIYTVVDDDYVETNEHAGNAVKKATGNAVKKATKKKTTLDDTVDKADIE